MFEPHPLLNFKRWQQKGYVILKRGIRPALKGLALALILLWSTQLPHSADAQDLLASADEDVRGRPYVPGELVVAYERGADPATEPEIESELVGAAPASVEVEAQAEGIGLQELSFPGIQGKTAEADREELLKRAKERLEDAPGVESVSYNYYLQRFGYPNDRLFGRQWGLKRVSAPLAWRANPGWGTRVGVVDSGIDASHPDLRTKVAVQRDLAAHDGRAEDRVGHGTAVAGVIAAKVNNRTGIAGACPECELLVAKDGDEYPELSATARGIYWAMRNGAAVVNVSSGGTQDYAPLRRAVEAATRRGVLVVASAGNYSGWGNPTVYPAAYPGVLSVGATDRSDRLAYFSSHGPWLDVVAPGVDVLTTAPGGGYASASGTSFSAPLAAGVAGLLAAEGLGEDRAARLRETARDLGPRGRDPRYGYGLVDARNAAGGPWPAPCPDLLC
jgi:subtilisin family serine protease